MPVKRLCCCPGCPAERLPNSNYCERHQSYEEERREKIKKHLEEWHKKFERIDGSFFNTTRWRKERKRFLELNPYCSCGELATEIHHDWATKDYLQNEDMFFDQSHWVSMCHSCHAKLSNRRASDRGRDHINPTSLNCFCTQGHYSEGWMNG